MTMAEFRAKWQRRAAEMHELRAQVDGAATCAQFLTDLEEVLRAQDDRVMGMAEAVAFSGYSAGHLRRLVKRGKLRTLRSAGSRGRLTFRASDLPRRSTARDTTDAGAHELASRLFGGKGGHHGRS